MLAWLLVAKPLIYLAAFIVAHKRFKKYGPHSKVPVWLAVGLAALMRLGLGLLGFLYLVKSTDSGWAFYGSVFLLGFAWWALALKLFFKRTPTKELLVFAGVCQAVSVFVDILLTLSAQDIRFCGLEGQTFLSG